MATAYNPLLRRCKGGASVALYHREITAALSDPVIKEKLEGFGFLVTATTPAALKAQIESDHKTWKPVIDGAGLGGQKQ